MNQPIDVSISDLSSSSAAGGGGGESMQSKC